MQQGKRLLRKRMKEILSSLPQLTLRDQSTAILQRWRALPEYQHARKVSVFLSMPVGEVQTSDFVLDLFTSIYILAGGSF